MDYLPLSAADAEIRLLTNEPKKKGSTESLRCQVEHASLSNPPSYVALSCHWRIPDLTRSMLVSGKTVPVTVNLELALRRLQSLGQLTVWADAIRINQADVEEKSLQIQRTS